MSDLVFHNTAPVLWRSDLRCVPIEPGTKACKLPGWQGFLPDLPNQQTRDEWLRKYSAHGIGVLLGSRIGANELLFAIDVDDDRLEAPIRRFLFGGNAPQPMLSAKKGKKGATFFVRMPTGPSKNKKFKGTGDLGQIELLGPGSQTVIPPTIHPETEQPYVYIGTPLPEAERDRLPFVDMDDMWGIGIAIGFEGIQSILDGRETHEPTLALVAKLVALGISNETITKLITAFLPESYAGNTLAELPEMIRSGREKFDEGEKPARDNQIATLINLAASEGVELFNDGHGGAYANVPTADGRATYALPSTSVKLWLRHTAFAVLGKYIGSNPILEATLALEAKALLEAPTLPVFRRVAGDRERVEIDFGRPEGAVVAIDRGGWKVELSPQSKFVRSSGMGSLPNPIRGGDLRRLQKLLGLNDETFPLVLAFLLNSLKPNGPYFVLLVEGEQGSGKSFLTQVIKRIIDPNMAERIRLPDNDRDLMIQAKEFWLLNFDNASGMKADISDALCSLATGGGIAVRKLYTDGELNVLSFVRPFVINGISNFVNRPDLLERAIPLRLPPLEEGARKEEAVLLAEFEAMLPEVLGVLYDAVSAALRRRDEVEAPTNLRMADAARWILAGGEALGFKGSSVIDAVAAAQDDLFIERVNDDPLTDKLRGLSLQGRVHEARIGDLFNALELGQSPNLPKTAAHLSKALDRLRPALARAGVLVEFMPRDRLGRKVRITLAPKGPPDRSEGA